MVSIDLVLCHDIEILGTDKHEVVKIVRTAEHVLLVNQCFQSIILLL